MEEKEILEELNRNWELMKDENMSSERFVELSERNMELMNERLKLRKGNG